jgi:hypothetical protein
MRDAAIGFGETDGGAALGSGDAAGGFATRGCLRSGLTCLATLSHSARSSSLKTRLRRGGTGISGMMLEGRRFIGNRDVGGSGRDGTFGRPA